MPVKFVYGNLFDFRGNLAHGTNATGKMGKGIATEFKKQYPKMFLEYEDLCKRGQHTCGQVFPYHEIKVYSNTKTVNFGELEPVGHESYKIQISFDIRSRFIYNICIKPHWRMKAEAYAVWAGLKAMVKHCEEKYVEAEQKKLASTDTERPFTNYYTLEIGLPKIGCGLGGLDWETQVKPIIEEVGSQTPCLLVVYLGEEQPKGVNESSVNPHDVDPSK